MGCFSSGVFSDDGDVDSRSSSSEVWLDCGLYYCVFGLCWEVSFEC